MALKFSIGNYYETYSENDDLRKGDVIKKIDDYDARDVRPQESQPKILPKSPVPPVLSPPREYKTYSPDHFDPPREHIEEVREERFYLSQPYRTTPLVLPGAKIKKDAPLGECYLRHHPNPMIRAAPHHYEVAHPEVAMKQKVAESVLQRVLGPNEVPKVVHKQFNSPIGLYSEQNIADTIKCQTTAIPAMKPVKYDPSKSEAYKALQEEEMGYDVQEVSQPPRSGVFAPQRAHHHRQTHAPPKSPALSHASGYDDDGEKIHQSNSFKRIMYSVLGTTDY
ncbi:PDZ and LIM domain protein 3 isoform X14 [Microplitis mediator]|uniref:PDZ and LIM domain protein 3 isoform X14 n=1 Tax=Microplitis mediator TaxID=375433 RepID=UPI002552A601|nr:PDZ and LIM domain protein 3 isoform X14 [Microplitis mediator]